VAVTALRAMRKTTCAACARSGARTSRVYDFMPSKSLGSALNALAAGFLFRLARFSASTFSYSSSDISCARRRRLSRASGGRSARPHLGAGAPSRGGGRRLAHLLLLRLWGGLLDHRSRLLRRRLLGGHNGRSALLDLLHLPAARAWAVRRQGPRCAAARGGTHCAGAPGIHCAGNARWHNVRALFDLRRVGAPVPASGAAALFSLVPVDSAALRSVGADRPACSRCPSTHWAKAHPRPVPSCRSYTRLAGRPSSRPPRPPGPRPPRAGPPRAGARPREAAGPVPASKPASPSSRGGRSRPRPLPGASPLRGPGPRPRPPRLLFSAGAAPLILASTPTAGLATTAARGGLSAMQAARGAVRGAACRAQRRPTCGETAALNEIAGTWLGFLLGLCRRRLGERGLGGQHRGVGRALLRLTVVIEQRKCVAAQHAGHACACAAALIFWSTLGQCSALGGRLGCSLPAAMDGALLIRDLEGLSKVAWTDVPSPLSHRMYIVLLRLRAPSVSALLYRVAPLATWMRQGVLALQ